MAAARFSFFGESSMTKRERQGWIIVASLFATLFLVFGSGYDTAGVFFTPLLTYFKWSRAQLSTLQGGLAISAGLSAPLIGWLLDRVEARVVMVAGAAIAGVAFLIASQANSFPVMLVAYLVLGIGIGASTLLPASLVIANWFGARRGLAMGLTFAGTSLGGTVMTMVGNQAIGFGGWRAGYITLGLPMIVLVIPLVLLVIRTRPPAAESQKLSVAQAANALPGLELGEAVRTRSFWMITAAQFLFACMAAGAGLHLITYLIGLGYTAAFAAGMMSLVYLFTSVGKLAMGIFADRVSARVALTANFLAASVGMVLIFGAQRTVFLVPFVIIFGLTLGAPLVLVPLLTVESLGLKRFGSIGGIAGVFNTIGAAIGPIGAGRIFDVYGTYSLAFEIFLVMAVLGALATFACLPLESEQARFQQRVAAATA